MAKPKRQRNEPPPLTPEAEAHKEEAKKAFRVCSYGLIPGLGAIFGPTAVVLGLKVRATGQGETFRIGRSIANVTIILGGLLWLTNWAGLVLIALGLQHW